MKEDLTPKQERFVQNIVSGMTQRQAYKEAFQVDYDDNAIDSNASTLFNSTKVQQRYKELMEKLQDEAIMSAKERMEWLTKVIKGDIKELVAVMKTDSEGNSEMIEQEFPSKLKTKLVALDTLNKMSGEYKTILDGSVGITKLEDLL